MQPRKIALCAVLIGTPLVLLGCSQLVPAPQPTPVPNPLFPPLEVVDGTMIDNYRDVGNILQKQQEKNREVTPHMTVAEFETIKLLELLDNAKTPHTIEAIRNWLAHVRDVQALFAKTPMPKKYVRNTKQQAVYDSYNKWLNLTADLKALQFNMRDVNRIGSLTMKSIDVGPNPPSYEEAKKKTLFYARQIPVRLSPTPSP